MRRRIAFSTAAFFSLVIVVTAGNATAAADTVSSPLKVVPSTVPTFPAGSVITPDELATRSIVVRPTCC